MSFRSYSTGSTAIYLACKYGFEENPMYMHCDTCPNNHWCEILYAMKTDLEIAALNQVLSDLEKQPKKNNDFVNDPRFKRLEQATQENILEVAEDILKNEKNLPQGFREMLEEFFPEYKIPESEKPAPQIPYEQIQPKKQNKFLSFIKKFFS